MKLGLKICAGFAKVLYITMDFSKHDLSPVFVSLLMLRKQTTVEIKISRNKK